jgi:hypothetical protein
MKKGFVVKVKRQIVADLFSEGQLLKTLGQSASCREREG